MIQSTNIDIPVANPQPAETKPPTFFTATYLILFRCIGYIITLSAGAIRGGLLAPFRHIWAHCYPRVAFIEEQVVMPHSALGFVIGVLLALAEIKAQGQPGFPFKTHSRLTWFSVISVLMYGLACAVEIVVSASGLDRASAFAIVAQLGKVFFLCILVASLACLLLF